MIDRSIDQSLSDVRPKMSSLASHRQTLPGMSTMSALMKSASVGARSASPQRDIRERSPPATSLAASPGNELPLSRAPRSPAPTGDRGTAAKRFVWIRGSQSGCPAPPPCNPSWLVVFMAWAQNILLRSAMQL